MAFSCFVIEKAGPILFQTTNQSTSHRSAMPIPSTRTSRTSVSAARDHLSRPVVPIRKLHWSHHDMGSLWQPQWLIYCFYTYMYINNHKYIHIIIYLCWISMSSLCSFRFCHVTSIRTSHCCKQTSKSHSIPCFPSVFPWFSHFFPAFFPGRSRPQWKAAARTPPPEKATPKGTRSVLPGKPWRLDLVAVSHWELLGASSHLDPLGRWYPWFFQDK